MKVFYIREPTKQQLEHEIRWTRTTNKVLGEIRSKGDIDFKTLSKATGYTKGTIAAQVSILRKMGLVSTEAAEVADTPMCPPHIWDEESVARPYGDNITIRRCRVCGETERI